MEHHDRHSGHSSTGSSSTNETNLAQIAQMREFRKMINSKREPQTVSFLRKIVLVVTILILGILTHNIVSKLQFYSGYTKAIEQESMLRDIVMDLFHIDTGFRTVINIDNKVQNDSLMGNIPDGKLKEFILGNFPVYLADLNNKKNALIMQSNSEKIVGN